MHDELTRAPDLDVAAVRSERGLWHLGVVAPLVGLACSVLVALSSPRLVGGAPRWFYEVSLPPGRAGDMIAFYVGLLGLAATWWHVGRRLKGETRPGELALLGALWALPLLVAPPLFSSDMYSYLAQGALLHGGLDPYTHDPLALVRLHEGHLLDAVSPFWRTTTAPYGPLFLGAASVIVAGSGSSLVTGVIALRLLECVGVALVALVVPRLAALAGGDPVRATWLAAASPLVVLELIAAGHNDALMAGLMVLGVYVARRGHPLLGVACCTLAATVKAPAIVAAAYLAIEWWRSAPPSRRPRVIAAVLVAVAATGAAVSLVTGLGVGWLSPRVLATPGKVHLAITPVSAVGWSAARLLDALGAGLAPKGVEGALGDVTLAATALLALVLGWRLRPGDALRASAIVLFVAALAGPAAWPWYFSWALVIAVALPRVGESRLLVAAVALAPVLVKPDGILGVPFAYAPLCAAIYLVVALALVVRRRGSRVVGSSALSSP